MSSSSFAGPFPEWPKEVDPAESIGDEMQKFRKSVKEMDVNAKPVSWYMPFESADVVRPALTAPICQLV